MVFNEKEEELYTTIPSNKLSLSTYSFRYFALISLLSICFVSVSFAKPNHEIKIGYFIAEPHIFVEPSEGRLTGAVYDLIENYIKPKTGLPFKWEKEPSSIPRQLSNLKQSEKFVAILLIFVKSRLDFSIYSARPYFFAKPGFAVKRDSPLKEVRLIEDVQPLVIGYAQNAYITPFMQHSGIRWDLIANPNYHSINLKKMLNGRIDAVYAPDCDNLLFLIKLSGLMENVRIVTLPEPLVPYHVVFSRDLKDAALLFNAAFEALNGQQLYTHLLTNYTTSQGF